MDYAQRQRLKVMARAEVFEATQRPDLIERFQDTDYNAQVERAVVYHVEAFDWNCPQHITPRWTEEELAPMIAEMQTRMDDLQRENERLRSEVERRGSVHASGGQMA